MRYWARARRPPSPTARFVLFVSRAGPVYEVPATRVELSQAQWPLHRCKGYTASGMS